MVVQGELVPVAIELDGSTRERLRAAFVAAYADLYTAGEMSSGTGLARIDGGLAIWNPHDESPAYNCLTAFEAVPDPGRAWAAGRAAAVAGGARVFGVWVTPERRGWASPERLAALGLTYAEDEFVWVRALDGPRPDPSPPPGLELATQGFGAREFATVLNRGWELPPGHARGFLYAATLGRPGWTHHLALVDGRPAGGAALYREDGVAVFMVAATDPVDRGRGVQTALIARRLADAAAAGCDLAAVETVAGNASPRNIRRAGFGLVHRRRLYRTAL